MTSLSKVRVLIVPHVIIFLEQSVPKAIKIIVLLLGALTKLREPLVGQVIASK